MAFTLAPGVVFQPVPPPVVARARAANECQPMKRDTISMMRFASLREPVKQMEKVKRSLGNDFSGGSEVQPRWVRLALNEAEAQAWLTPFPDLLFPVLAEEKASMLHSWAARQRTLLRPKAHRRAWLT